VDQSLEPVIAQMSSEYADNFPAIIPDRVSEIDEPQWLDGLRSQNA
jgi:hypothetical protein